MINFLKYKNLYFLISVIAIGIGLISIFRYGFRLSIDFVGGSKIEYKIEKEIPQNEVAGYFKENKIRVFSISKSADTYIIRTEPISNEKENKIRKQIVKKNTDKIILLRFETVGPTLGRETIIKTATASLIAIFGILIYLTFAFKNIKYALAAVLAMLHDFMVVAGIYSLLSHFLGAEVDSLFVTAILTTMSFSVHDTIVVFDKIRENEKNQPHLSPTALANRALTETMVRSLNNSITIILMLMALLLIGGETIRFFVATLLIGTITGTYSSPFVATPLLVIFSSSKVSRLHNEPD